MAAVDFVTYHQQFLPKFLTGIEGLSSGQQQQLISNYKMVEVSYIARLNSVTSLSGEVHVGPG